MPSRWRRNARTGCSAKRTRSSSATTVAPVGGERLGEERRRFVASLTSARAPSSVTASKLHGCSRDERAGREVPRVEGLERMAHDHALVRRAVGRPHGRVDDVEELADRDGGRPGDVRALVVARVRDDQPVRGREQRVEQQLPVLGARIAVADVRVAEHEVVAVAGCRRGTTPSSIPSRQTTRCGTDRIGMSVQTVRWPVRKFARVGRPRSRSASSARISAGTSSVRAPRRRPRLGDDVVEDAVELGALPRVAFARRGQGVGGVGDRVGPGLDRLGRAERVERRLRAGRRARRAGRRDGSSPLSTSSSGRTPLEEPVARPRSSSTPSSTRSSPARHVFRRAARRA